uniref:Lysozyme n=1 Tax=Spodoptera frugiperda TaxID=7108 RepID=A0A2H1VQD1_SPOFR
MERAQAFMENFIGNWNGDFPNYPLTAEDLKKPHAVMGALLQVLDRLGIDTDVVLAPPPKEDRNENTIYYWDLLPVINMTRVINHLVSVMPQVEATISIVHFLQPTATTSHSILLLLFNLMVFNEEKMRNIAPYEEELFAKTGEVKALEEKKNRLLEMLNEQAEEKGKRAGRLEKLDHDIKVFEEELKQEKEIHDEEKLELEVIQKENKQTEMIIEQKKSHRDALMAEVARKRALRVYDADDIKAQAEQATQNLQELEEKLDSLRAILMQKENSLKNLQTIKPNLDSANNLLHEIMKLSDSLKDFENGDLDTDSKEGELDVLNTELGELQAQLSELQAARDDAARKRAESQAKRQQERTVAHSSLREAEEKDKKLRERSKKALQRTEEIKELTTKYENEKTAGIEQLATIKNNFCTELKTMEELLLKKVVEAEKKVEEKLKNRHPVKEQTDHLIVSNRCRPLTPETPAALQVCSWPFGVSNLGIVGESGIRKGVFLALSVCCDAKYFKTHCDLVHELRKQKFAEDKMRDWVCLIDSESGRRTDVIGGPNKNGSRDYGLFQINDNFWCSNSTTPGKGCRVTCADLITDDITKASICAHKIFRRQGFPAWHGWTKRCQGDLPDISDC